MRVRFSMYISFETASLYSIELKNPRHFFIKKPSDKPLSTCALPFSPLDDLNILFRFDNIFRTFSLIDANLEDFSLFASPPPL